MIQNLDLILIECIMLSLCSLSCVTNIVYCYYSSVVEINWLSIVWFVCVLFFQIFCLSLRLWLVREQIMSTNIEAETIQDDYTQRGSLRVMKLREQLNPQWPSVSRLKKPPTNRHSTVWSPRSMPPRSSPYRGTGISSNVNRRVCVSPEFDVSLWCFSRLARECWYWLLFTPMLSNHVLGKRTEMVWCRKGESIAFWADNFLDICIRIQSHCNDYLHYFSIVENFPFSESTNQTG